MAADNTKIGYEVEITKKGDGAKVAAEELKQVQAAAQESSQAVAQVAETTTKAATSVDNAAGKIVEQFKEVQTAAAASGQALTGMEPVAQKLVNTFEQSKNAAGQQFNAINTGAQEATSGINELSGAFQKLTALATSSAAIAVISGSISEWQKLRREILLLEGSMRVAGQFSTAYSQTLREQAEVFEDLYLVEETVTLNTQAMLIQFGATSEEVDRLTRLTIDLSAATGRDMNRATMMMTQALSGEFEMFKKLGVQLDEGMTRNEKYEATISQLEKRFGGMADEIAGANDHLDKFKQKIDDQKKIIGEFWLGATSAPGGFINRFLEQLNSGRLFEAFSVEAFQNAETVRNLTPRASASDASTEPTRVMDPTRVKYVMDGLQRRQSMEAAEKIFGFLQNTQGGSRFNFSGGGQLGLEGMGESRDATGSFETRIKFIQRLDLEQRRSLENLRSAGALSAEDLQQRLKMVEQATEESLLNVKLANRGALEEIETMELGVFERREYEVRKYHENMASAVLEYFDAEMAAVEQGSQEWQALMTERDVYLKQLNANLKKELSETRQIMAEVGQAFVQNFAGGFSSAVVQMIQGTKSMKDAFQDFAASLLANTAQMIMELLIFTAIKRSLTGTSFGGLLGFAGGGAMKAASGLGGVAELTTPTYLPNWNVIAGEAGGHELMTVLSNPQTWSVGGAAVVSGNVGPSRLAMLAEQDFKSLVPAATGIMMGETATGSAVAGSRSAAGRVEVVVTLDKNLEGRIIDNSIEGAVVRINNDLTQDSQTSRAVKDLTS
jgi:hypothetical protein